MRYLESLNKALHQLITNDDKVIVLGEDIADPYGGAFKVTKGLSSSFPKQVFSTPISEAAIIGLSTGLAMNGYKPIVEIMFGDFITLASDQIINGLSKFKWMYGGNISLPLIIRTPMGARRGYGPTHSQTLESLFFGVPGINIVAPSHCHMPGKLMANSMSNEFGPTIFIENKSLYPMKLMIPDNLSQVEDFFCEEINTYDNNFPTISLKLDKEENPDITIIAYGGMAPYAMEAAKNVFLENEIVVELLLPSIIKPLPLVDILPSCENSGSIIICEEGVKSSGWGSELASLITENIFGKLKHPIERIGAKQIPIPSSRLLEQFVLPQAKDIKKSINKLMK